MAYCAPLNDDGSQAVNDIRLYFDGTLQKLHCKNNVAIGQYNCSHELMIGAHKYADVPERFFQALIDEVRLFDRALSAQVIQEVSLYFCFLTGF
jgi:hypothetical protein